MDSKWRYPTAFSSWGRQEADAIERVIGSGRFTQGAEVEAFEQEFAAYHGMQHCIMVNSGSSANLVAVAALRHMEFFKPGDRALVPAIAWSTTYAPLVQMGLDLVVCDVDETWNANPEAFRHDPGNIKVVMACSILGNPGHLAAWSNIAGVLDAQMIEDNCESLGAYTVGPGGAQTGTYGLMSTASFFWSHQIGAIEGGAILTNSDAAADVCRILRAHGWTRDVMTNRPPFLREYDFVAMGFNVRALELHAAIAREQLKKLPAMIEQRRNNVQMFWEAAISAGIAGAHRHMIIPPLGNGVMSPFGIHFEVNDENKRQGVADALRAEGIDCRMPTGGSFLEHPYARAWGQQSTPIARRIHYRGMFIGNGPLDLSQEIGKAVAVLKRAL